MNNEFLTTVVDKVKFGIFIIVLLVYGCVDEITPYEVDIFAEISSMEELNSVVEGGYVGSTNKVIRIDGAVNCDTTFADTVQISLVQFDSILFTIGDGRQFQFRIDSVNVYDQIFTSQDNHSFYLTMPDSLEVIYFATGDNVIRTEIFNGRNL